MVRNKVMGYGDMLRCLARYLIYYAPDYEPNAICSGCCKEAKCIKIRKVLGDKDGEK